MKILKIIIKTICLALCFFLIYALAGATLPFFTGRSLSEESVKEVASNQYYSDTIGPDRVYLVESPEDALNVRIAMLRSAQKTIDVTYYKFTPGESSDMFFGELLAAAERGVEVRVLTDGKTAACSKEIKNELRALNTHEGLSCRLYNSANPLAPWRLQSFMHDKFIIVDGEYALIGGRNIDDRHFNIDSYEDETTYDRDVFVWRASCQSESVLSSLSSYMDSLWFFKHTQEISKIKETAGEDITKQLKSSALEFSVNESNDKYYVNDIEVYRDKTLATNKITLLSNPINTSKKEPIVGYALSEIISAAKESVTIQTPYATGNKKILSSLERVSEAAELSIITNSAYSTPNYPAFSNYLHQRSKFIDTGASLFEYHGDGSIHAKTYIIDRRLSAIGSHNLDDRSLYLSTETMVVIDSEEFTAHLLDTIEITKNKCEQVGTDNKYISIPEAAASKGKSFLLRLTYILLRPFQSFL